MGTKIIKAFFLSLVFSLSSLKAYEREALYLTWFDDPSSSMVIRVIANETSPSPHILLKDGEKEVEMTPTSHKLSSGRVHLYTFSLKGLQPDTKYFFRFADESKFFEFCTLPKGNKKISFVVGGDICEEEKPFKKVLARALAEHPDFLVLAGDISYYTMRSWLSFKANREWNRWKMFFKFWDDVTKGSSKLYPIVTCPGNHDVKPTDRPNSLYLELFLPDSKDPTYHILDIGGDTTLWLLDTGHFASIEGPQTQWLQKTLAERENKKWKIGIYHVAAYPSYYPFDRKTQPIIRETWVPLFEKYHMTTAFEHHNHAYKKTFPIYQGKVNAKEGMIYFGDGCWGVPPRTPMSHPYLEKSGAVRHFYFVEKDADSLRVSSVDEEGRVMDVTDLEKPQ